MARAGSLSACATSLNLSFFGSSVSPDSTSLRSASCMVREKSSVTASRAGARTAATVSRMASGVAEAPKPRPARDTNSCTSSLVSARACFSMMSPASAASCNVHTGGVHLLQHLQHARALHQEAVAAPLHQPELDGQRQRARGQPGQRLVELFARQHGGRVFGPRHGQPLLEAQPLAEVEVAALDAAHQVTDGADAQPAVLQHADGLEAVHVRGPVEGGAPADLGGHQRTLRLIEADGAARHARVGGQLVDGHPAGLVRCRQGQRGCRGWGYRTQRS
jgi:hypothetical protein